MMKFDIIFLSYEMLNLPIIFTTYYNLLYFFSE